MQDRDMDEIEIDPEEIVLEPRQAEREPGELVVGLDIGTTKIFCVVGEVYEDAVNIIGVVERDGN